MAIRIQGTVVVDDTKNISNVTNTTVNSVYANNYYWANGVSILSGGAGSVPFSDAAPVAPSANSQWFDTSVGAMFGYYSDGTSNQFVEVSPGPSGLTINSLDGGNAGTSVWAYYKIDGGAA